MMLHQYIFFSVLSTEFAENFHIIKLAEITVIYAMIDFSYEKTIIKAKVC